MKSIDFFLKFEEMKSPRLANPSTQGSANPTGTLESESPLRHWSGTHTWNILHIFKGCAFFCCLLG